MAVEGGYFIEWVSVLEGALKITWSWFFTIQREKLRLREGKDVPKITQLVSVMRVYWL